MNEINVGAYSSVLDEIFQTFLNLVILESKVNFMLMVFLKYNLLYGHKKILCVGGKVEVQKEWKLD